MRQKKPPIKQVNLVPNVITAFSLACGLFVIFKAVMTSPGGRLFEMVHWSIILLLFAAVADFLDGAIARAIKAESIFGFMFDSLADAVTFGVAPAVVFVKSVTAFAREGEFVFFSIVCAMTFSMCGILRLVRFNVEGLTGKKTNQEELALKKSFTGLPIPAAAIGAVSVVYFLVSPLCHKWFEIGFKMHTLIIGCWLVFLGYLMVSRLRFPSLKSLHLRVTSFPLLVLTAVVAILMLYGLLYYLPLVFMIITVCYLFAGLTVSIVRTIKGRKLGR